MSLFSPRSRVLSIGKEAINAARAATVTIVAAIRQDKYRELVSSTAEFTVIAEKQENSLKVKLFARSVALVCEQ